MKITKALITAAGSRQRTLPLQILIDRDGVERSVLHILLNEIVQVGVETIGVPRWRATMWDGCTLYPKLSR